MPSASDTPPPSKDKRPTKAQISWLARGLEEPGGKLPLFTTEGQRVNDRMVQSCLNNGWAEPWFENPLKPNWLVCKLTDQGRAILAGGNARQAPSRLQTGYSRFTIHKSRSGRRNDP